MARQRAKGAGKLSEERKKKLDALGIVWQKPDAWEMRYTLAANYFKAHGDLRVPAQYKAEGVWLNKWLNEQRQIYLGKRAGKSLCADQIHRLNAIGMHWGATKGDRQPLLLSADEQKKGLLPIPGWRPIGQDSLAMP